MINPDKKVSIIIPVYNSENFIRSTIESAINQTWINKELIIVDDGSTDNSLQIAKDFESDIVKVYTQENRGASGARNKGLMHASGRYIQFLDSDDILAPSKIEKQLIQLQNEPEGSISSGSFVDFIGGIENSRLQKKDNGCANFEHPIDWLVLAARGEAMFPTVVWLTPRTIIENSGKWNEALSYNDDSEFFARVVLKSKKVVYVEESLSYYRRGNSESLGSQKNFKARKSEFESLTLVSEHLLKHEKSERITKACAYQYCKLYYSLFPEFKTIRQDIKHKLNEIGEDPLFVFGKGYTNKIGKLIGWKAAKWLKFIYNKF